MNFQLILPMYLVSAFKLLTYSFFFHMSHFTFHTLLRMKQIPFKKLSVSFCKIIQGLIYYLVIFNSLLLCKT